MLRRILGLDFAGSRCSRHIGLIVVGGGLVGEDHKFVVEGNAGWLAVLVDNGQVESGFLDASRLVVSQEEADDFVEAIACFAHR